jgi:hypothetical protein
VVKLNLNPPDLDAETPGGALAGVVCSIGILCVGMPLAAALLGLYAAIAYRVFILAAGV